MKAVIALCFLVLASQAIQFNVTEYTTGYNDVLGLAVLQDSDVEDCIQDISQLSGDVMSLVSAAHSGAEDTFFAVAKLYGDLSNGVFSYCEDYKNALMTYIQQNEVIPANEDLRDVMVQNLKQYAPEVIQDIAQWAGYIMTGQDYNAGRTHAVLFQTLIGANTPSYPVPQLNFSDYVPFNPSTFYPVFYQSLFTSLGYTNQTLLDTAVQCGIKIQNVIDFIISIKSEIHEAIDVESRLDLLLEGTESVFGVIGACRPALEADWVLWQPFIQQLKQTPVKTLLHLVYNVASNLPEIILEQKQYIVAIEEGEYELAGQINAAQQMAVFDGLFNFNLTQVSA